MNKTLCAIGAGFALLPAIAAAQANVQVNASNVVRASVPLYGINTTIWDPEMATTQTFDLLTEASISFLRLPGGSLSDEYHWLTNTSRDNTWKWASGFKKPRPGWPMRISKPAPKVTPVT